MRALVTVGAALGVLAGCSSTASNALEEVERTSVAVDATTTTTTAEQPATTTTEPDELHDDLVTDLRASQLLPSVSRSDAACIVSGLRDRLGDEAAGDVIAAAAGDLSLDVDEAQEASDVMLGCVDGRSWVRTNVMRSFGANSTEGSCIATTWNDDEIEGLLSLELVTYEDRDAEQLDLTGRLLAETGRCLSEDKVKDLLIGSALQATSTSLEQATCYADERIRSSGAAEATRQEFGGTLTVAEASTLYEAMNTCFDVRAQFGGGLEEDGYTSDEAACVVDRLTDRDIRTLTIVVLIGATLGRDSDLAFDHFDAADMACGVAATGT